MVCVSVGMVVVGLAVGCRWNALVSMLVVGHVAVVVVCCCCL